MNDNQSQQPKDNTNNKAFMGFTNHNCPFLPCHSSIKKETFNCLFCYCPLSTLECPGPYIVFVDKKGIKRKDCSNCTLNHDGHEKSWNFIQKWLEVPIPWDTSVQSKEKHRRIMKIKRALIGMVKE